MESLLLPQQVPLNWLLSLKGTMIVIIICFCKEEEWTTDHESYSSYKPCGDAEVGLDLNRKCVHKNQQSPDKKEYKVSLRCKDLKARLITDAEYAQNEKHLVK